jgi:hypothetical protein
VQDDSSDPFKSGVEKENKSAVLKKIKKGEIGRKEITKLVKNNTSPRAGIKKDNGEYRFFQFFPSILSFFFREIVIANTLVFFFFF